MDADAVMRKCDMRNIGGHLRHVARRAVVAGFSPQTFRKINPAARVGMASAAGPHRMGALLIGWPNDVWIVACGAGQTFRRYVTSAATHLFDVPDHFHLRLWDCQMIVDAKIRERQAGPNVGRPAPADKNRRLAAQMALSADGFGQSRVNFAG